MDFTLKGMAAAIKSGALSPIEAAQICLKRIAERDRGLNAFVYVHHKALEEAAELEKNSKNREKEGPLFGVPIGVKDMFCVEGMPAAACSKILEGFVPPYSATVIEKLKKAGALIIGKCNNDEFAMGSSSETSSHGPCKNPYAADRSPGGSSSGSAAAVAGGLCPGSLGTDTGGSVRLPAHFCNLTGLKPTYGRVSRYGMIAYGSSLDQAGPIARTVEDCALLLDAISGWDPKDSTSAPIKDRPDFFKSLNPLLRSMKVGFFPVEDLAARKEGPEIHPAICQAEERALAAFKSAGCQISKAKWPLFEYGLSAYYLIAASEAASNLSRYDGVRYGRPAAKKAKSFREAIESARSEGFGLEVKRRILIGSFCLSHGYYDGYFQKAAKVRRLIKEGFEELFQTFDVILSPVALTPAFKLGEKSSPLQKYLNDQCAVAANLAGLPALSLPAHFSEEGLPVGVQLTGPDFGEQKILNAALALQKELQVCQKEPPGYKIPLD